jgi:hypothetical protein
VKKKNLRTEEQGIIKDVAKERAAQIDKLLGRTAPQDPYARLKEIALDKVVPERLRQRAWFVTIADTLKLSGIALAGIALAGDGTVAALVAAVMDPATMLNFSVVQRKTPKCWAVSLSHLRMAGIHRCLTPLRAGATSAR